MNPDPANEVDGAEGRFSGSNEARTPALADSGDSHGAIPTNTASVAAPAATSADAAAATAPARVAACACGDLRVTARGEPLSVYACACLECQRATGAAFSYRARYASDAGRWVEHCFCPRCGSLVYMEAEALPDAVVISVGAFADPDFAAPGALHRSARRHRWYELGCRLL